MRDLSCLSRKPVKARMQDEDERGRQTTRTEERLGESESLHSTLPDGHAHEMMLSSPRPPAVPRLRPPSLGVTTLLIAGSLATPTSRGLVVDTPSLATTLRTCTTLKTSPPTLPVTMDTTPSTGFRVGASATLMIPAMMASPLRLSPVAMETTPSTGIHPGARVDILPVATPDKTPFTPRSPRP